MSEGLIEMGAKSFVLLQAGDGNFIVVDEDGTLQRDASRYLAHCKKWKELNLKTLRNMGYAMKAWFNYLRDRGRDLYDVTDYDLVAYRDLLAASNQLAIHINQKLGHLCAFYWHAEEHEWCRGVIGFRDHHKKDEVFGITVDRPRQGISSPYVVPFLLKVVKPPRARVPTSNQVAALKDAIADRAFEGAGLLAEARNVRNQLMIRWMAEPGLRCMEVVSLPVKDIPKAFPANGKGMVRVTINKAKNSKIRDVLVEASLIRETLLFIDNERKTILRESNQGHDCKEIFASTQSNQGAMTTDGVREIFRKVDSDLHPHALRRYALTRFAAYLYQIQLTLLRSGEIAQIDRRSIELELAQQAGHSKVSTTYKFYVDIAISMVMSPAGETALHDLYNQNSMMMHKLEAAADLRKIV